MSKDGGRSRRAVILEKMPTNTKFREFLRSQRTAEVEEAERIYSSALKQIGKEAGSKGSATEGEATAAKKVTGGGFAN